MFINLHKEKGQRQRQYSIVSLTPFYQQIFSVFLGRSLSMLSYVVTARVPNLRNPPQQNEQYRYNTNNEATLQN